MTDALSIENLLKTYSNGVTALKGINLTVKEGDFFALLGPNGAGKSTTIGIITSLVNKTSGKVKIFGFDMDKEPAKAKACVGVVPQEFNFNFFEKCLPIILNQAGYYGVPRKVALERAEKYLTQLDLWDKRNEIVRFLSGGMKRRLMIARALIHQPKLLILDEPTAGVDIELRRGLWSFLTEINRQGTTVILTTHYLEEAEHLCKNIAIIDQGKLIAHDSMKSLLQQLHVETFVLYLENALSKLPSDLAIPCRLIDETTLEVDLHENDSLSNMFEKLIEKNIRIKSMRNKANRLEELFLNLTSIGKN